jgi:N-acetylneuraminic acid mutarotase
VAGVVLDGKLYVFGGEGNAAEESGVFAEAEVYDPATDAWEVLTPMATPRHGTGAAALDGVIYVPAGATEQALGAVDTNDAFHPP